MSLTEDGVVDFFTGTVENGHVVVGILRTTVTLDGIVDTTEDVELREELGTDDIVGIEDDHVVEVSLYLIDGILHGFSLGTLLEGGGQQYQRQRGQVSVGLRLHVVGDNDQRIEVRRIVLFQKTLHGIDDNPVLVVGRV